MSVTRPALRRLRIALLVLALLVLLPVAAGAVLLSRFDANHYKPRIAAALERATGRAVALDGDIRVRLRPVPTLEINNASLANMPDGSRPEMVTVQRLAAEVAVLPLLHRRIEITRLVLVRPDILLETDAAGRPNWRFPKRGAGAPTVGVLPPSRVGPARLVIHAVQIEDGALTWRDGRTGATQVIGLSRLALSEANEQAPIVVSGNAVWRGSTIAVAGQGASLALLRDTDGTAPWPVQLSLAADGAEVKASGSITNPHRGGGYALKVEGTAPDLTKVASLIPEANLPALHDVAFTVQIAETGDGPPVPSAMVVRVGPSDLEKLVPGLKVSKLDVSAPSFQQPVHVEVQGSYASAPLQLTADLGIPAALLPSVSEAPSAPFPIDITGEAAGARFAAKGAVADPAHMRGLDVKVTARIPDLAALSPLARRKLPRLTDVALDGELTDRGDSYASGVVLKGLKLSMPQADLTGGAVVGFTPIPSLHATLAASRIDLDAIPGVPPLPPLPVAVPASAAATSAPAAPAGAPARGSSTPARTALFSDRKLPLDTLMRADLGLHLTVGMLRAGGLEYRDVVLHLGLHQGRLRISPLEGQLAGEPFNVRLDVNAGQPTTPIALTVHAPGIALKPLFAALRLPDDDSGALEVDTDLNSAGATPRAIVAALTGHIGLALVNGSVDNRLLAETLDKVLHDARPSAAIGGASGHSDVRCFASRLDLNHGVGDLRAFVLDMTHFRLAGTGAIDLANETLALRLRPLVKVAGSGVVIPVRVEGTFLAPHARSDTAAGAAKSDRLAAAADSGDCAPALALARGGRPAAASAAPPKPEKKLSAHEMLRHLLR